jgi:hypothetical protein
MKRIVICIIWIMLAGSASGQLLSGDKYIPGSGGPDDYATIAAAVAALNTQGVGAPGVNFRVAAGYTENLTAPLVMTAAGDAGDPITFEKNGDGLNPLVIASFPGTRTPSDIVQDGIWALVGSDYVTIDGIDLQDPNSTNPETMEYGYGFFKASSTNGCQYNTIKNCTVTLSRSNNDPGIAPFPDGSRAINVVNALVTDQVTPLTITETTGSNSYNKFYKDVLQQCNTGIAIIGFAAAYPFSLSDIENDIGGNPVDPGAGNFCRIINFGGGGTASPAAGILTYAQHNLNISNNLINNNDPYGTGANHAVTIRGIYTQNSTGSNLIGPNEKPRVLFNRVTIRSNVTSDPVSVIENTSGSSAPGNLINISFNEIVHCHNELATSSNWYGIFNRGGPPSDLRILGNNFVSNTTNATTGNTYLIYNNAPVPGTIKLQDNNLRFRFAGMIPYSGTFYGVYNDNGTTMTDLSIYSNTFWQLEHSSATGTGIINYLYNTNDCNTLQILYNVWRDSLFFNHSGPEYLIRNGSSTQASLTIDENEVWSPYPRGRLAPSGDIWCCLSQGSSPAACQQEIKNNSFEGINASIPCTGTFHGIHVDDGIAPSFPRKTIWYNLINEVTYNSPSDCFGIYINKPGDNLGSGSVIFANNVLNVTTNGTFYGIYLDDPVSSAFPINVGSNMMYSVTTNGGSSSVYGIFLNSGGSGVNCYKNKLYDFYANGPGGAAHGIYVNSGTVTKIYNNLIGHLFAPLSSLAPQPSVTGLYINGGATSRVYYNTVYLDETGNSGSNFGSAAFFANTAPAVELRNNILVNKSVPTGTGVTCAYQRWGADLSTYATGSDNNLFYAGIPGPGKAIFYNGTASYQALDAYQVLVNPRDLYAVTEDPPLYLTGSFFSFLHINPAIPTQVESGGEPVVGIPDDYDSDLRSGIAPDIGADEGTFVATDLTPPVITYIPLLNTNNPLAIRTLDATIVDNYSAVPATGSGRPVLYWKFSWAVTWNAVTGTNIGGNTFRFLFVTGGSPGDIVQYYIVARDTWPPPNIISSPRNGSSGFSYDPPACSTPPLPPDSYQIVNSIGGTYTVGTGGNFPTLTAAVAALNSSVIVSPVVFSLISPVYTSPAETFPIVINPNPGAAPARTVTIRPRPGLNAVITGSVADGPLIVIRNSYTSLEGSNFIIGLFGRNLTITNTSTSNPEVIRIGSTGSLAVNNSQVRYCNINNGTAGSGTAVFVGDGSLPGTAGYFTNIIILNNSIRSSSVGISCIAAGSAGNGTGVAISRNEINSSVPNNIRLTGIYLEGTNGTLVSQNKIANLFSSDPDISRGIWIATGTVNATISSNQLTSFSNTSTGDNGGPVGIYINTSTENSNIIVKNNTISGFSSTMGGLNNESGIFLDGLTSGVTIQANKIFNIKNTDPGGCSATGILLNSRVLNANTLVYNNVIFDIAALGTSSLTSNNGYGIDITGGGGYNIYFNSIRMATPQSSPGYPACIKMNPGLTANSLNVRNNIFSIETSTAFQDYAVLCNSPGSVFSDIDYNDYYSPGPNICYLAPAGNVLNLAAWRGLTGRDASSASVNPLFVAPAVLTPRALRLNNTGITIPGITTDFNNRVRSAPPDFGAIEFDLRLTTTLTTSVTVTLFWSLSKSPVNGNDSIHMIKVQDCMDGEHTFDKYPGMQTDVIDVWLVQDQGPYWPYPIPYDYVAIGLPLNTDGTVILDSLPGDMMSDYYIIIKHRNCVETWSAEPVSFAKDTAYYDFTTSADQAYGGNEEEVYEGSGIYGLYSGDITSHMGFQDGYIDIFDNNDVFNMNQVGAFGYIPEDVTGDAFVDIFDMASVFNNMQKGISVISPACYCK